MTRIFTVMALATIFCSTAMAQAAPDFDKPVCDSAQFKNQGQWIQCLHSEGLRGRELARAIHDEHVARKGVASTERGKQAAKRKARRASWKLDQGTAGSGGRGR